jgi:c-di-GMP-specific phosphodiesterase
METASTTIAEVRVEVLNAIAGGMPLRGVADLLCHRVEQVAPGFAATVVRVDADRRLRPVGGPSMPKAYRDAIDGVEIGDGVGACGSAAFRGEPVLSQDPHNDPTWPESIRALLPTTVGSCWSSPIKDGDGQVLGTFAFYYLPGAGPQAIHVEIVEACLPLCRIAIERQQDAERIALLTHYDALTGLPNRASLRAHLSDLIDDPAVHGIALLHIDIDRFADINESLGFSDGDRLLVSVAERLHGHGSLASGDALFSLGGDGYALVVPEADAKDATRHAEHVLSHISAPFSLSDLPVVVSASIGISLYPNDGPDSAELMRQADAAVGRAKASGGGGYRFSEPAIDRAAQDRIVLGVALRAALRGSQLRLAYQPQVEMTDMRLHAVEALSRWDDPTRGPIPPDRFIPLAEQIGQVSDLDAWGLREACRQLAEWDSEGLWVPSVSVNFSPLSFREGLPDLIASLLDENGLTADRLTIEVTESVVMDDTSIATAWQIRELGVGLSVDDFGTGFSAIGRLPFLPITELKIDRSFLERIDENPAYTALTRAVVGIGESLGLRVIAEGVETVRQAELLGEIGCPLGQGFLFAKPEGPEALRAWLISRNVV